MSRRSGTATLLPVPFIATLVWYLVTLASLAVVNGRLRWRTDVLAMAIGGLVIGLPVAAAVTLVVVRPLHARLQGRGSLTLATVVTAGVATGLMVTLAFAVVTGAVSVIMSPAHGLVVGSVTAAAWWWLQRPAA